MAPLPSPAAMRAACASGLLAALLGLLAAPASAQECRVVRYGLTLGSDSTEYMTVSSGGACSQVVTAAWVGGLTAPSSLEQRVVSLSELSLVARPQHGSAGVSGRATYAYKARPGYVGPDRFTVLARGSGGASRITVQVNVVP